MSQGFLDRTQFGSSTSGTLSIGGTISIGGAQSPEATPLTSLGQTPAVAGAGDGVTYTLLIRDGAAWMTCRAVYNATTNNFTVSQILSSSLGFGNSITLSGSATVAISLNASDLTAMIPVLPLVNGDTPGPAIIADSNGQCIGVPLL